MTIVLWVLGIGFAVVVLWLLYVKWCAVQERRKYERRTGRRAR